MVVKVGAAKCKAKGGQHLVAYQGAVPLEAPLGFALVTFRAFKMLSKLSANTNSLQSAVKLRIKVMIV